MKKYDVGFIGYGNMAQAIVSALSSRMGKWVLKQGGFKLRLAVSDIDSEKLLSAPKGVATTTDVKALVDNCDVVVCAIKPQHAKEALEGLDFTDKIVVSIMASVTIDAIKSLTGRKTDKIARIMPNLNARIGNSYSSYCTSGLSYEENELVRWMLSTFGGFCEIDEKLMNSATGLCGSGPAFVFKFIKALVDDAVKNGFSEKVATEMAVATVSGSVNLVLYNLEENEGVSLPSLINSVCSKGGTTIEGVKFLDENNFDEIVGGAVDKAAARAEEMSRENEKR